jgi:putative acetyltransferase
MQSLILKRTNSDDVDFRVLVAQLDADLRQVNGEMMDIYDQHNVIEKIDTVVIACLNNEPVGCGCFKPYDANAVEIKRMYVQAAHRGKGISKTILAELESWAKELGYKATVLETGTRQVEGIALYTKAGYKPIPKYGPYIHLPDSLCFKKAL